MKRINKIPLNEQSYRVDSMKNLLMNSNGERIKLLFKLCMSVDVLMIENKFWTWSPDEAVSSVQETKAIQKPAKTVVDGARLPLYNNPLANEIILCVCAHPIICLFSIITHKLFEIRVFLNHSYSLKKISLNNNWRTW